jgi:hypothetical protein
LCDPHCRLEYARVFSSPPLCNSFEIQNHSASESDQLESTTCGTRPHLQDRYGAKLQTSCRDQKARCVREKPNSFAFLTCAETTPSLHHSCSQRSLSTSHAAIAAPRMQITTPYRSACGYPNVPRQSRRALLASSAEQSPSACFSFHRWLIKNTRRI